MENHTDKERQNPSEEYIGKATGPSKSPGLSAVSGSLSPGPATTSPTTSSSYPSAEIMQDQHLADDEGDSEIYSDEELFDPEDDDSEESSEDESDCEVEDMAQKQRDEEWTLHRCGPRPPEFASREEMRILHHCCNTPFEFFKLIFTNELLQQIVDSTNERAKTVLEQCVTPQSSIRRWKPITVENIIKFLGILFHMGNIVLERFSDYWRKDSFYNFYGSNFMSKNDFLLIFSCLRFGQYNLNSLIDYFNNKMAEIYSPGEELSIFESFSLSRGRSGIWQNIGKRHENGIKLHMLATPNGFSLKIHLHEGKSQTDKVVKKLLENYLGTGRHVYMGSNYNSVGLSEFLLRNGTNVTGTLRANREGNPAVIAEKLHKSGSIYRYNRMGVCVCKWRGQRDVLTISTIHSPELKQFKNKRGQHILKPEMVVKYKQFMSGSDWQDEMLADYTCEHKTMRWYKKVGIHIFQLMMLNAYYLYEIKVNKKIDFYSFRCEIITEILPPPPPNEIRQMDGEIIHVPDHLPKDSNGKTKRRRCKHCWDTTKKKTYTLLYCPTCADEPGLCVGCFRAYHNY